MSFIKRHWLLLLLFLAFLLTVYFVASIAETTRKAATVAISAGLVALAFLLGPWIWPLLLAVYVLNWGFGFLGDSFSGLYNWIPRQTQDFNAHSTVPTA